jgi:Helicase associated domain
MSELAELPPPGSLKEEDMEEDEEEEEEDDDDEDDEELTSAALVAAAEAAAHDLTDPEAIAAAVAAGQAHATKRRRAGKKGVRPWNDMLFELLKYRFLHGNVMVPFKSGGELGKWVAVQRAQYLSLQKAIQAKQENNDEESRKWTSAAQEGGSERLTEERMKVLSSIGFVWDVVQADNDARWKRRFEELKEYKAIHGHCNVPQSTDLGKWVKMQRENKHEADMKNSGCIPARKKPKPCLSHDRVERLESIGFQWRVAKPAVGWENRYEQLVQYRLQHGDCNVPQSYPPDKPFGRWVMKQRCQHSLKLRGEKSQLTDEREKKLNDIGFSWVAPGFSKKTVTMPGDEEEHQKLEAQAVAHMAAQQQEAAAAAAAAAVAAGTDPNDLVGHAEEFASSWNV